MSGSYFFRGFAFRLAAERSLAATLLAAFVDFGLLRIFEAFFATRLLVATTPPVNGL